MFVEFSGWLSKQETAACTLSKNKTPKIIPFHIIGFKGMSFEKNSLKYETFLLKKTVENKNSFSKSFAKRKRSKKEHQRALEKKTY